MVFFGEFSVSLTGGGRVVLPKKLRELLKGNSFVLAKGFDACLAGYDKEDWEQRAQELLSVSLLEKENLEKRRFLFASASYLDIDEQGRFVVPKHLFSYAQLGSKITIVGVGDHFEIWNPEKWTEYMQQVQA
jgi:MraZ protein